MLALVLLASCDASRATSPPATPDPSAAASRALAAVWASFDGSALMDAFPRNPGTDACVINIGPPPGRDVAATCSTAVQRDREGWLVNFIETWDARSFRGGGSPRSGPLTHIWQFHVKADGQIAHTAGFGDFPPQGVM